MKLAIGSIGLFVSAAALASCSGSPNQKVAMDPSAAQRAAAPTMNAPAAGQDLTKARHGLQDKQLGDLMKRISAESQTYWSEDVPRPRDDLREGDFQKAIHTAAKLAESLAAAAERIPVSAEHIQMSDADRAGFRAQAETLRSQALRLGETARAGQADKIQESLDAISSTCISCHNRYRDFAGELDVQRVSADHIDATASLWSAFAP